MTQIRETIESLCKVLKYNGIAEITAETFRLAKFDKPEATVEMWIALKNFLKWLDAHDKTEVAPITADDELSKEGRTTTVRFCKHNMYTKGYRLKHFFTLQEDMRTGSRDVLLALGWIMAKEKVFEKFINNVEHQLTEDPPHKECLCLGNYTSSNISEFLLPRKKVEKDKLLQAIQYLILMKGKLIAASRSLLNARDEYALLLSKIHLATCQFPQMTATPVHLSACEVFLLYHPKEFAKNQDKLELENSYLSHLLCLKNGEVSFWKWMESVLELKLKARDRLENESETSKSTCQEEMLAEIPLNSSKEGYKPSKTMQKIKEHQVEFSKLLQVHENLYKKISKMQKKKRYALENSEEMREQLYTVLPYLDSELFTQLENLSINKCTGSVLVSVEETASSQVTTHCGSLTLISNKKNKKKHREVDMPVEQSRVAKEICKISDELTALKNELSSLGEEHKDKMLELSQLLKDVVCIPPHIK